MVNDVNFTFDVSGFSGAFKVESFRITETVSSPFEMNLTVLSDGDAITFEALSRKMGVLSLFGQGVGTARQFNGSISELRYLGSGAITLPWFHTSGFSLSANTVESSRCKRRRTLFVRFLMMQA